MLLLFQATLYIYYYFIETAIFRWELSFFLQLKMNVEHSLFIVVSTFVDANTDPQLSFEYLRTAVFKVTVKF